MVCARALSFLDGKICVIQEPYIIIIIIKNRCGSKTHWVIQTYRYWLFNSRDTTEGNNKIYKIGTTKIKKLKCGHLRIVSTAMSQIPCFCKNLTNRDVIIVTLVVVYVPPPPPPPPSRLRLHIVIVSVTPF